MGAKIDWTGDKIAVIRANCAAGISWGVTAAELGLNRNTLAQFGRQRLGIAPVKAVAAGAGGKLGARHSERSRHSVRAGTATADLPMGDQRARALDFLRRAGGPGRQLVLRAPPRARLDFCAA